MSEKALVKETAERTAAVSFTDGSLVGATGVCLSHQRRPPSFGKVLTGGVPGAMVG